MAVYLSIFGICVTCFLLERSKLNKNTHVYIDCILIAVLAVVVGSSNMFQISDMQVYQYTYKVVPDLRQFSFATIHSIYGTYEMEKGFLLFISLLKTLHINFRGFYVIHTLFVLGALYYGMSKYVKDFSIVVIMFLYKLFFYNLFISMRQSIAIAIFWIILHYIEEKKIVPYMLGCLVALHFHFSALILFPIYFIRYLKLSRSRVIVYISTMLVLSTLVKSRTLIGYMLNIINNPTIQRKVDGYISAGDSLGIFHTVEYFVIMFIIILFYNKIIKDNPHGHIIVGVLLILAPIVTVFRDLGIITRFKDYFTVFYGVVFGLCYKLKISNRVLLYVFCIGLSLFGYVRYILLFGGGESLLPYKNVIFDFIIGG